ncbi:MAG TPA: hypothetical protein VNZ49_05660 [Bacteroidia bacterium]|jgi:hypothetical protein|nr:hypothetical protein [Bacteroidia bacterium]
MKSKIHEYLISKTYNMSKKLTLILAASTFVFACTPKASKSTATTTTGSAPTVTAKPTTEPGDAHVTAARVKFPDVTLDVLKQGHGIYYGACTRCHGAKDIVRRDEKEWVGIMDDMAPKAKLTAEEKDAVWKYVMAVKLVAAK